MSYHCNVHGGAAINDRCRLCLKEAEDIIERLITALKNVVMKVEAYFPEGLGNNDPSLKEAKILLEKYRS